MRSKKHRERVRATDKLQSDIEFRIMSLMFRFRDLFSPRSNILKEAGIAEGFRILDYGCGDGSYIAGASELVGESGTVYALDIHPLAIKKVQKLVERRQLKNVQTIHSECETGLHDNSLDAVLLYDVLHDLGSADSVLTELHRVLKPAGTLSISDHHLKEAEAISRVTGGGLFRLSKKGEKTLIFAKVEHTDALD